MNLQKKTFVLILLFMYFLSSTAWGAPVIEESDLDSYVLIDRNSGHVLLEKGKDTSVNIEGATNILTSVIAAEKGDLDKKVSIGENPVKVMGTKVYLQEKEKILLSDLVKAALVYSANDAAMAIAEHISGSDLAFVEELNNKVREIGCENTVFTNSYGQKDSRHVTTAYDLALIAKYAMNNEKIVEFAKIKSFNWSGASWQALLTNRNILLEDYPGITGLMAATRGDQERLDLIFSYQLDDKDYILVMTNARAVKAFDYAAQLIEFASENFQVIRLVDEKEPIITVSTVDGKTIQGLSERSISIPIRIGVKVDASKEFFMNEIKRPLKEGDKIGEVVYFVGGEELERMNVLSDQKLSIRFSYLDMGIYAFAGLYLIQIIYRTMKMRRKPKRR
jgi:D-alanyl-D-alanine carboxypeptidase (penicillin-binding protein 5/6)